VLELEMPCGLSFDHLIESYPFCFYARFKSFYPSSFDLIAGHMALNGLVYGLLRDQVTKLVNKNRIESPRGLS
jgi:hypothetical protein